MISPISSRRKWALPLFVTALVMMIFGATFADDATMKRAIELYDAGQYAEARPLLEQLVQAGNDDGKTLYRLYYCERSAGDAGQRTTLEKARAALEREAPNAEGFEVGFYLANAYANLGQEASLPEVAARTTARFEAGAIAAPTTAMEQFRLGKLYADQRRDEPAGEWYSKAVDGFLAEQGGNKAYLEWALRWIARRAIEVERFEEAANRYAQLSEHGRPTLDDWDRWGLSSLMIGRFEDSEKAWQKATRLDAANADRYRYGAALAKLASKAGDLPISPDGERSWEELSREELENLMRARTQAVKDLRAESEAIEKLTPVQRNEFGTKMLAERPAFVAAAIEYTRRGLNLREAAFFGGFAPMVFHDREWRPANMKRRSVWNIRDLAADKKRREQEAARDKEAAKKKEGSEN